MPNTTATPSILQDPGFLFWAPLGSVAPTNTVTGSVFTDAWPAAWINLGATAEGSTLSYTTDVEPVRVAELFDPIKYSTTDRSGSFGFALADFTVANLKRVLNGGASVATGTTATTMTTYAPPDPGTEVRSMVGWESLDATVRVVAYQCFQGGSVDFAFRRAPDMATIPAMFNMEKSLTNPLFRMFTAGVARG